jgi:hypothetical protein
MNKVCTVLALVMVLALPTIAMAQDAAPTAEKLAEGQESWAKVILGLLLYVACPIVFVWAVIRGVVCIVQRHEVDKGVFSIFAGLVLGLLPAMLSGFFGIKLEGVAELFKWGN